MIEMTLGEVATAVNGRLAGASADTPVTGTVEYDSRKIGPGGLFVAFAGEQADGHDFAGAAVAAGAVAVIGTRAVDAPHILVADPLVAMARLAGAVVDRLPELTVIGLTGSSGKTTTKDLIAQVTAKVGPTVAPAGTFNNELGHPYTVLRADTRTRYLVLEMGARGIGHIRYLCEVARPRIGIVLNVGVAHLGEFGSQDQIALAKGELVEALPPGEPSGSRGLADTSSPHASTGGVAILNADDPRVAAMSTRTAARVVPVGESPDALVRAVDVSLDERGRPAYTLVMPAGSAPVRLAVSGRHQVGNTLVVAAVAGELGVAPDRIADWLGDLRLVSTRRMDVFDRAGDVTVIDDSYNANPASMAAALHALSTIGDGRRTVAVLGYMAELGGYERSGHEEVGRLAATLGVDLLVVVGQPAGPIHDGAVAVASWGGRSVQVTDQDAAIALLRDELRARDVVLVKGSRYRTWAVADALRDGTGPGTPDGAPEAGS
jgi:UDP-N-acetylmuramoyl-tripeptide--D-alanyl-D-alanine ligase